MSTAAAVAARRAQSAIDARARRAARTIGLVAHRSRRHAGSVENRGGFMLINPRDNTCEASPDFNYSAEDVLEYVGHCRGAA